MTKYATVLAYITSMINNGTWPVGTKLPSIRSLATQFQCNKDTISHVLQELKYQNIIYAVAKSGNYVLTGVEQPTPVIKQPIKFANSIPDETLFPYNDFRACLNQVTQTSHEHLFTYFNNPAGYPPLITAINNYFNTQHLFTGTGQIAITSGIQQALYILTRMPFPNHKQTILLEQPTYHQMNALVENLTTDYLTITRNANGLDWDALENIFKTQPVKFFYTIPRFSVPYGQSYTNRERAKLCHLAQKYDVYLVEDDYFADFENNSRVKTLYEQAHVDHVIYLRSFSKIIFPALRLGAVIMPQKLFDSFINEKQLIDYDTNMFMQRALAIYLTSSMFTRHRHQITTAYHQKARRLNTFLQQHGIKKNNLATQVVLHFDTTKISALMLTELLKQQNLEVNMLTTNYIGQRPLNLFSIDVRNMPSATITANLTTLWAVIGIYIIRDVAA